MIRSGPPGRQPATLTAIATEREQAVRCFESGDYETSARLLVSLLARTRPDPLLLRLCGMALTRTDAAPQGLPYLARARRLAPQDPVAALWHGIALHAAGRFEDAVLALDMAARLAPDDPGPPVHLSRALLKLQRPQEASNAAARAVALAPLLAEAEHAWRIAGLAVLQLSPSPGPASLSEAWLALGRSCARLGRIAEARGALEEALSLRPDHVETAAELALVEHLCGEPLAAIARLREALAREPASALGRQHLASRLLLGGDAAAALALLDRPPEPPARPQWHGYRASALISLGRHQEARLELAEAGEPSAPGADILLAWQHQRLARLAGDYRAADELADRVARLAGDRDAGSLEQRVDAQFDLASLHHATGRHEAAFAHWRQGHAMMRAAQPFSRAAHTALIDAIIDSFSRARLADGPCATQADPAPVFIVGLPRTGTTLTEHILSAHRAVHGAGERLAVREMLVGLTGTTDAQAAARRAASLDASTLDRASGDYLSALHALSPTAARVLDKMPDNVFQLGFIATLLPGARVICCTRDLRDVGMSIFQRRFLGHHPYAHDLGDLGFYMAEHERLMAHWRRGLTIPMLEVDHADWVSDFDATLRRVLDFLGLDFDPACSRFFEQQRPVETASRDQVARPINAEGVGRWRPYARQLMPMIDMLPPGR